MLGIPRGLNQLLGRDIVAKTVLSLGTHSEPMTFFETGKLVRIFSKQKGG